MSDDKWHDKLKENMTSSKQDDWGTKWGEFIRIMQSLKKVLVMMREIRKRKIVRVAKIKWAWKSPLEPPYKNSRFLESATEEH